MDTNPWPNGYSHGTRFNDCFEPNLAADPPNSNANPNANGNGNGPKLTEILGDAAIDGLSDPIRTVARYVTAALLNNAGGKVPEKVLRAMTIQHIWAEFAKTGYFAPTSGTRWSAAEIVDYLRSTMTGA